MELHNIIQNKFTAGINLEKLQEVDICNNYNDVWKVAG